MKKKCNTKTELFQLKKNIRIIFSILSILTVGCTNNNCPLESNVFCNYGFYDSEGTAVVFNDTVNVTVFRGTKRDTLVVNKLVGQHSFPVPMSYYGTEDTVVLDYASLIRNDTIIVRHESYPHVELPECGTKYFHTLKDVYLLNSGASIDDIEISNPEVNYFGNENIKIYLNGVAK